jgi:hypothetical protein
MTITKIECFQKWLKSFKENYYKRQWMQGKRTPKYIKHWT